MDLVGGPIGHLTRLTCCAYDDDVAGEGVALEPFREGRRHDWVRFLLYARDSLSEVVGLLSLVLCSTGLRSNF
jgi:hypothetical protein